MPKTWKVFQNNFRNIIKDKKEKDNIRNFGESITSYKDKLKNKDTTKEESESTKRSSC